jgi:alkylation response protein AidB-like acyl-CoA dehydrogenase
MQSARSVRARRTPRQPVEGDFLLKASAPDEVFTPEDLTDEHLMVRQSAREFFDREVFPRGQMIEEQDRELTRELIQRAAGVGFLGTEIPESDGGLGLGLIPAMLQIEQFARHMSFCMAIATQTGIGSLPIVFFGTEQQKRRYMPGIMSGEIICAFALTENQSGSDALSARARATLDGEGRNYLLNCQKMWVTNAGFADLFIVFAKVDGKHFTAFLVERQWNGVGLGAEESKMGMHGSSTRPLMLDNVRVPVENVLGEVGGGHKVAFGTLNVCRSKLGAGLVGAAKEILSLSVAYSQERKAFGHCLTEFELIREKLARMTARIYAAESIVYRTADLLTEDLSRIGDGRTDGIGHAIESSIVKVFTSEMIDFVADEGVQIHGSNGYSSDYPIERFYRDARVNRIFEGTNEIHRLLIPDRAMKLARSGVLPLQQAVADAWHQVRNAKRDSFNLPATFSIEHQICARSRRLALILMGAAVETFGERLQNQQILLATLSDLTIDTFAVESVLVRTIKALEGKPVVGGLKEMRIGAMRLFIRETFDQTRRAALRAAGILEAAGSNPQLETVVNRLSVMPLIDSARLCQCVSEGVIAAKGYPF